MLKHLKWIHTQTHMHTDTHTAYLSSVGCRAHVTSRCPIAGHWFVGRAPAAEQWGRRPASSDSSDTQTAEIAHRRDNNTQQQPQSEWLTENKRGQSGLLIYVIHRRPLTFVLKSVKSIFLHFKNIFMVFIFEVSELLNLDFCVFVITCAAKVKLNFSLFTYF